MDQKTIREQNLLPAYVFLDRGEKTFGVLDIRRFESAHYWFLSFYLVKDP